MWSVASNIHTPPLLTDRKHLGQSIPQGVHQAYLSKMSWLDVVVAPSSPSAALPAAAAAPLPASMILTHCNEQPAREAEREGEGECEEVDQEGERRMR